jgi:hypothetical protein
MLKTIDAEWPAMSPPYLTQVELAVRWRISPRTLERWRWAGGGPRFIKIGGRVVYRIADIEAFEQQQLRTRTDAPANQTVEQNLKPSPKTKRNSSRVCAQLRGNRIEYDKLRRNAQ